MRDSKRRTNTSRFVRNGIPDGYVVRLANLDAEHFPTATRVEVTIDGIDIYNERIHLAHLKKDQFVQYWQVQKNRKQQHKGG